MASRKDADWIKTRGRKNLTTYCERCADAFTVTLPIGLSCFAALVTAFVRVHRKCRADVEKRTSSTSACQARESTSSEPGA